MPRAGSTVARGYGNDHQRERTHWKALVEAGFVQCAKCAGRIEPGTPWDLGHDDSRTTWTGPEHRRCNRAAGGRKRWAKQKAQQDKPADLVW